MAGCLDERLPESSRILRGDCRRADILLGKGLRETGHETQVERADSDGNRGEKHEVNGLARPVDAFLRNTHRKRKPAALYALKEGRVEQGGNPDEVYKQGGIYKEILDASARSLNIDKIARTISEDGSDA